MPEEVLEYLRSMGKKYGKLGGKASAQNLTPAERSARAKKASLAAAKKRTAERLAREAQRRKKGNRKGQALTHSGRYFVPATFGLFLALRYAALFVLQFFGVECERADERLWRRFLAKGDGLDGPW
jgi:hypothetical protein